MKVTLVYHMASGRIIREPAEGVEDMPAAEVRDRALRDLAEAMIQRATKVTKDALVPLLTVTDDQGRDHLLVTANIEDVEVLIQEDPAE